MYTFNGDREYNKRERRRTVQEKHVSSGLSERRSIQTTRTVDVRVVHNVRNQIN